MAHKSKSHAVARETPVAYTVDLGARGRLVLPADVRDRLDLKHRDQLILSIEEDGSIRLCSRAAAIASLKGMLRPFTRGQSAVDGLIAERRREARQEASDARKAASRARRR